MGAVHRKADTEGKATKNELARILGVQPPTIAAAFRAGRIRRDADGLFDVDECRTYWAATRQREPVRGDDAAANGDGFDPASLAAANLRKAVAQADLAEMSAAEKRAELVDAAKVKAFLFDAARVVREQVLGVPQQVAPLLAGQSDHEIRRLLDAALRQALTELPAELPANG